ncbi:MULTISPECIES: hypothetical protein [unclassified Haloferax]|uniref:hypothetical protein n=1 Tax=unclassified Haloferax TaxID=2625095 RepID=UPI0028752C07|nr:MULTISPECIES: hypothetical protein [unclassified Haloferax]MDS0243723.1 hypothetical protein [Haloferax sp. S2CR25]MDS0446844.1 hypothetical protein [Haloferax sp. S2CR25-2]
MTSKESALNEEELQKELGWLVDIPLFVDKERVSQLYDLTIEPIFNEFQRTPVEESKRELEGESDRVAGGVEAGIEGGGMLSMIAGGKLKGWIEGEHTKTGEEENSTRYRLTQTPQRQLAQISIQYYLSDVGEGGDSEQHNYHYIENPADGTPDYREEDEESAEWLKSSSPSDPRDLVVLELPGLNDIEDDNRRIPTKLVPTAAEFEDGTVVQLYQEFENHYEKPPRYPERDKKWGSMGPYYEHIENHPLGELDRPAGEKIGDNVGIARDYYWKWFGGKFNGKEATIIVEEACAEHGDIRWIDFRLPLNETGFTLHLHAQPREEYNTGTFAYNLIKRGYKHGLMLVGTVKSEPDMDVLAIYER